MLTTLLYQLITIVSGIVIPQFMIKNYGSSAYGATSSITQFLSYVTLLEGGIGGVARAELYKPLADGSSTEISKVYNAVRRVFRIIGCIFLGYTVVLACSFRHITDVSFFSADYTFFLVIAISISTIAQYFFGIANLTLLNADQKRYISNLVMIVTTALNALLVIILIKMGCDILTVKLCSSSIFILRPLFFSVYVKRHYQIDRTQKATGDVLQQKWTGLGQHLAYYLHTNTDVAVLTVFADLKWVAVYGVYNLVISSMRNIISALTGGMEALFGEMIARKEKDALASTYHYYDLIISCGTLILFGTTAILIVPFVRLYTMDVSDAEYIQPVFALVLLFAEAINCMFLPCSMLPVAANKFKETRWGAYGEAAINVGLSCLLVLWNPLVGVAIATTISVLFKNIFYFVYVSKNILHTTFAYGKRYLLYILVLVVVSMGGYALISCVEIGSMTVWVGYGFLTFVCVCAVVFSVYTLVYGKQFVVTICRLIRRFVSRRRNKA